MGSLSFDVAQFRESFPAFSSETTYPDAVLNIYWAQATCYVENSTQSRRLSEDCLRLALNLMTAHLAEIANLISQGTTPDFVTSSTVGSVSVAVQPPPNTNQWQWWLSLTPYGQQLYSLLSVQSIGGFFIGGSRERSSFRGVAGIFR